MLNKAARRMSTALYCKNYISSDEIAWCIYVIEKLILRIVFLTVTFTWVVLTQSPIETLLPIAAFCLLRSKIGGYHAKHAALCLLLSSLLVITCKPIVDVLVKIDSAAFWAINLFVSLVAYFISPAYPDEAEISDEDAIANSKIKRVLIILILSVQVLAEVLNVRIISVSLFYGVMMAITSVLIKTKGRKKTQ